MTYNLNKINGFNRDNGLSAEDELASIRARNAKNRASRDVLVLDAHQVDVIKDSSEYSATHEHELLSSPKAKLSRFSIDHSR